MSAKETWKVGGRVTAPQHSRGGSRATTQGDQHVQHTHGPLNRRVVLGIFSYLSKRNGNPLQYSCLENIMDGGAW